MNELVSADLIDLKRGNMLPRKGHPISPGGRRYVDFPIMPT